MKPLRTIGRCFLALILCLPAFACLRAQTVAEVAWTSPTGTGITGLMVFTNEENAFMRVAFDYGHTPCIVQVDYAITVGKDQDMNFYAMRGSNPRFIQGHSDSGYMPDHFVWTWGDDDETYDLPYTSDDLDEFDIEQAQQADSYMELGVNDVDEAYLLRFFLPDEPEYKSMRKVFGLDHTIEFQNDVVPMSPQSPTLHLILLANTAVGDIGGSCEIDKRNLVNEFQGVCEVVGLKYKRYVLDDQAFSKAELMKTLDDLRPNPNDVVVFVYRGHGFRWSDQQTPYPQLDLRVTSFAKISPETSIGLEEVYERVSKKGARLNLFFADCCNSDVGMSRMTTANFMAMQSNQVNFNEDKLRRLFLDAHGGLVSAASSPGEVSWANNANGGFYTVSLLQSLREEISFMGEGEADWDGLMHNTMKGARYKSSRFMCGDCSEQNGIFKAEIEYWD